VLPRHLYDKVDLNERVKDFFAMKRKANGFTSGKWGMTIMHIK
jgi:hypothetical protein